MIKKAYPVFFAALLLALAHFHNDVMINWADEGLLWVGSRLTLEGLVPIRDFQSYDPGRYYWCASIMHFSGDGLLSLRWAAELFQFLGLLLGLSVLSRVVKSPWILLGSGLVAFSWMLMPFRNFDSSMAMLTLFFAVRLAEKPSQSRCWAAGLFTALAAFMGINHGFYAGISFMLLAICLHAKGAKILHTKNAFSYGGGVLAGLIPFIVLCVAAPGFWGAYLEKIPDFAAMLVQGKTNVPFSILWPWQIPWSGSFWGYAAMAAIGVYFLLLPLMALVAVWILFGLKKIESPSEAVFVSALCTGAGFFHTTLARPDVFHVGDGVFPVWVLILVLPTLMRTAIQKIAAWTAVVLFTTLSFLATLPNHNVTFKVMTPVSIMIRHPVGPDNFFLSRQQAVFIEKMKRFIESNVPAEEPILMAPMLTTFYGLLDKKPPTYEMYFVMPVSRAAEERNIRDMEMKHVHWALVSNFAVNGSPEHSLSKSHPRLWKYLMDHFVEVSNEGLPAEYRLMDYKMLKRI